ALNGLGANRIQLLNRHADKAGALTRTMQPLGKSALAAGGLDDWKSAAPAADLVINSTSAGMKGNRPFALHPAGVKPSATVLGIVCNPLGTALFGEAEGGGHQTIDGLGMLMHQAAPSFEAFFGVKPEVTPGLRARLIEALSHG